jgi:hypothetical protein
MGTKILFESRAPNEQELCDCHKIHISKKEWNPETVALSKLPIFAFFKATARSHGQHWHRNNRITMRRHLPLSSSSTSCLRFLSGASSC